MQHVVIYRPAKTAMQSGRARTKQWVMDFAADPKKTIEPLMGWTSSAETRSQVRMLFRTLEDAVAYADANGYAYTVKQPHERAIVKKAYADNFAYRQVQACTPGVIPPLPGKSAS